MKRFLRLFVPSVACVVVAAVAVHAQTNDGTNESDKGRAKQKAADIPLADRFRELDKNSDAKLTREELGTGLFLRAAAAEGFACTLPKPSPSAGTWQAGTGVHLRDETKS